MQKTNKGGTHARSPALSMLRLLGGCTRLWRQVLNELANVQRHVVLRIGVPAVRYLSSGLLPSLGLPSRVIEDYVVAIHHSDPKVFRAFFRVRATAPPPFEGEKRGGTGPRG